jgi:hypothetical protein
MTVSRLRPSAAPGRRPFARLLCCLALASGLAHAADEPQNGSNSTFNTPGYPNATQRGGTVMPGQGSVQPGAPSIQSPRSPGATGTDARDASRSSNRSELYPRRDQPPPKPGEFQKFVETATGRLLPLFGSSFFADAADP